MAISQNRAPMWFRVVAVLIVLWGVMGIGAFYMDVSATPEKQARMSAYDQNRVASRPTWFLWLYGVAVWSGLLGGILLLVRSSRARPVFILSLVAAVAMFAYIFAVTDIIAVKGFAVAAGFPIVITVIASFQIWFAALAQRRGWIA